MMGFQFLGLVVRQGLLAQFILFKGIQVIFIGTTNLINSLTQILKDRSVFSIRIVAITMALLPQVCMGSAGFDFKESCEELKMELEYTSSAINTRADYNITYSGSISSLGVDLEAHTTIRFGENEIKVPYIGKRYVDIQSGLGIARKIVGGGGGIRFSYHRSGLIEDVRGHSLGLERRDTKLFDRVVYVDWLTYRGFNYRIEDLDCQGDEDEAARVSAVLLSKAVYTEPGARVLKLVSHETGFVQINRSNRLATVVILSGGKNSS